MTELSNKNVYLGEVLSQEFHHTWQMLRQAIKNITPSKWNERIHDWSFSFTVYHIIETAEFYNRNTPEGMEWGKRAGFSWTENSDEEILERMAALTKEDMVNYLNDIEESITKYLANVSVEDLFTTDGFDNGKLLIIKKLLYLLRHNMHHIGELNKFLRDIDSTRINWE